MQLLFLLNFRKFDESNYLRRLRIIEVPTTKIRMHHILFTPENPKQNKCQQEKITKSIKCTKPKLS